MNFEKALKQEIKSKYGNVRAFSKAIEIPYSTINNIFDRGIMGVSVQIVLKICGALNIDIEQIPNDELVYKTSNPDTITDFDHTLITAYRAHPEAQASVNKLLDIVGDSTTLYNKVENSTSRKPPLSKGKVSETDVGDTIADDIVSELKKSISLNAINSK